MKSPVVLLGGSFNPPHNGHMRLAVETAEALAPCSLNFVPCACPPHKPHNNLLPFALRCHMLEESCALLQGEYAVNRIEGERQGPSYTVDTLALLRESMGERQMFFVLGAEDFAQLATWHAWHELPKYAHLLVVARQGVNAQEFAALCRTLWADARPRESLPTWARAGFTLPGQHNVYFMALPRLDINASLIRQRWMAGRSVRFWLPEAVLRLLEEHAEGVRTCWRSENMSENKDNYGQ